MNEHVIVFGNQSKFGKVIPSLYEIRIFGVPEENKGRIIMLLKRLGFSSIKEERKYESVDEQLDIVSAEIKTFILANYHVRGVKPEYDDFWNKKEIIEITVDSLLTKYAN